MKMYELIMLDGLLELTVYNKIPVINYGDILLLLFLPLSSRLYKTHKQKNTSAFFAVGPGISPDHATIN